MDFGFEHDLYKTQEDFINDGIKLIKSGKMGVFSSPTGTGKTISLLCTSINFLDEEEDDFLAILSNFNRTKVYYCSRTHTQLEQAYDTLKTNKRDIRSVILGSRQKYCVNPKVNKLKTNEAITEKCKSLIKNDECTFDIEDSCPYYNKKNMASTCEIVFLPYNLIFSKEARDSFEIDLKDKILIIDEAHNIYNTVIDLNTVQISFENIKRISFAKLLNSDLTKIIQILKTVKIGVYKVDDFLYSYKLFDYNMLNIEEYILTNYLPQKNEMPVLFDFCKFLKLLTFSDHNGRVFVTKNFIKFTTLNPKMYFDDIIDAKSVIFAGGTMDNQLSTIFPSLEYFEYAPINNNFKSFIITHSIRNKPLKFTFENRNYLIKDLIQLLVTFSNPYKGVIFFVPSYEFLGLFRENAIGFNKKIYYDNFEEYKIDPTILVAVMGGKLSEGINFSDDLCRLLIVIGVPFPTKTPEFIERSKYDKEYGVTNAMQRVNQALGRCLRHKNDYAAMILIDIRYLELKSKISNWIGKNTKQASYLECLRDIHLLFRSKA